MKKKLSIGSWITLGHIGIVEVMSGAGFEWLCIDLEHSVIDYYEVQTLISTIQNYGIKAFVRIGENSSSIIKRVLDAGADGIICPMVNTAEQAQALVRNIKYPPMGTRGVGLARAQKYGLDSGFENYRDFKSKEITIIAQIEHYEAINNLEHIIQVDGLDGTFIGPYDLSGSMGKPGDYDEPDVKEILERFEIIANKFDKYIGVHVIKPESELVNQKIEKGYNFIAFSIDTLFLGTLCRTEMLKINQ